MPGPTVQDRLIELAGMHDTPWEFAAAAAEAFPALSRPALASLADRWRDWEADGVRGTSPIPRLAAPAGMAPALARANTALLRGLAGCAGATRFRRLRNDQFPGWADGLGGRGCVELSGARGRVLLGVDCDRDTLYVEQIAVERKGDGLGTALMERVRAFAADRGLSVVVYKVRNGAFFDRFGWLERSEHNGNVTYGADADALPERSAFRP